MTAHAPAPQPLVLSIAGSDSGGGAGIQADLKTFTALGSFGATAITCVTAQNPDGVTGILALPPDMVEKQIDAVAEGFPIAAVKTGMLYSADIIGAVVAVLRRRQLRPLVVDPVMVATSGARLLREDAIQALCRDLLPLAAVVTPNMPEAEILCGHAVRTREDLRRAAADIGRRWGCACVAKGGHGAEPAVWDILFDGRDLHEFESPRVAARETHGTGCTFSAALAALLARGLALPAAVREAKAFVTRALATSEPVGRHWPLALRAP